MGESVEEERMRDRCSLIIVRKFSEDRWSTPHVARRRGVDEWAVKVMAHDLEQSGLQHFIYKSDGENAIQALKTAAAKELRSKCGEATTVKVEESGTGEFQHNGVVERAIWEVESKTRTLVHAAQEFHGVKLLLPHPVRVWAVEHASQVINRGQKASKDGRAAYESRQGRPHRRKLPAFAEAV
eukprot:2817920-Pyramimonas_sp.AAC.1